MVVQRHRAVGRRRRRLKYGPDASRTAQGGHDQMSLRGSGATISASTGLERSSASPVFGASIPVGVLISSLNSRMARPAPLPIPASRVPPNSSRATMSRMTHSMPPGRPMTNAVITDSFNENGPILGPGIKIHAMAWPHSASDRRGRTNPAQLKPQIRRGGPQSVDLSGELPNSAPDAPTQDDVDDQRDDDDRHTDPDPHGGDPTPSPRARARRPSPSSPRTAPRPPGPPVRRRPGQRAERRPQPPLRGAARAAVATPDQLRVASPDRRTSRTSDSSR